MQSKVASFVDPNSDVEESRIYIQTGKVKRRWQLSFFEKYHEISLKIMAWEEVPRNSIKELAIIGKKNIKKIVLDMLPYWWNYMEGINLENCKLLLCLLEITVEVFFFFFFDKKHFKFFIHAWYPWLCIDHWPWELQIVAVLEVMVDYSMALMREWLEKNRCTNKSCFLFCN